MYTHMIVYSYDVYDLIKSSTFYTEKTLHNLLCKPKNRVAAEDKNNIAYEIDCSNCETVFFGESKRSL